MCEIFIRKSRREQKELKSLFESQNFKRLFMIMSILLSAGSLKANEILRKVTGFSPELTHDEFGQCAAELGAKVVIANADEWDTRSIAEFNIHSDFSFGGASPKDLRVTGGAASRSGHLEVSPSKQMHTVENGLTSV